MFDVAVIGGNLSGTTASINAAKMGVNVILIEKNKEPLFPARCGEATDAVTSELLNLEGIGCQKNDIKQITINVSSNKEYQFKLKEQKISIIDRNFLEKYLLKSAKQEGVKLKIGHRMKAFNPPNKIILDNGEIINGKVIIDATGICCQIGKQIGINTKLKQEDIGVCIQSRVQCDIDPDIMKLWFHRPYAPLGYAWFFPKNKKLANIGLGIPGGQKIDMKKRLDEYIVNELGEGFKITHTFRACVPAAKPIEPLSKDNIMFVGDAARLANPIFENGINNAVFSGSVSGIIAAKYIKGKISSLKYYDKHMNRKVKRISKMYNRKIKIKTEGNFIKSYRRGFYLLHTLNRLFPNLLQNQLIKIVKKDRKIINSLQKNEL